MIKKSADIYTRRRSHEDVSMAPRYRSKIAIFQATLYVTTPREAVGNIFAMFFSQPSQMVRLHGGAKILRKSSVL